MTNPKIDTFRNMLAKNPENPLAHFGLANELTKEGSHAEALDHLKAYLARYDDEGNGYLRLADALTQLGRLDEARAALRAGAAAATRFGHVGLANDLEARLEDIG